MTRRFDDYITISAIGHAVIGMTIVISITVAFAP